MNEEGKSLKGYFYLLQETMEEPKQRRVIAPTRRTRVEGPWAMGHIFDSSDIAWPVL